MKKRWLSLFLALVICLGIMPLEQRIHAANNCVSVLSNAPTTGTTTVGGLFRLELSRVFSDSSGHHLTYSFQSNVSNEHTKIANGAFFFSAQSPGTYQVELRAKCGSTEVKHTLTITVNKASEGIAAQYGYDETNKAQVTVYVTLSNDGFPLMATDGTIMSHMEVTVPYFDLGLYGLEEFYRYGTTGGKGVYTSENIIQRPTGLHLYIYLLERYYIGLEENECCRGLSSGVLDYMDNTEVCYMDGELAYESNGKYALTTTGGATSIYMTNFWGHDENLMYYRNHCYPYMDAGWGSTSDYILLSDGDTWDVAMFTNWDFYHTGYFTCFDKNAYTASPNSSITVKTQKWGTSASAAGFESVNGLTVALYNSEWELLEEFTYDSEGGNAVTIQTPTQSGTYYVLATDPNAKDPVEAKIAPATAKLLVTGTPPVVDDPVVDNPNNNDDKDKIDVSKVLKYINGENVQFSQEEKKVADMTGDGMIDMCDIALLLQQSNG